MESRLTQGTPRDSMIRFATVVFPDALPPARPGVCVWRGRERKERRGEKEKGGGIERRRREKGVCYYMTVCCNSRRLTYDKCIHHLPLSIVPGRSAW